MAWGLMAALVAAPAAAQVLVDYNIPSQALGTALLAYSRQSGVQVLYDTRIGSGRSSAAVVGRLPSRIALNRLLEGTGLEARYAGLAAVTLRPAHAAATGASPSLGTLEVLAPPMRLGTDRSALDYAADLQTAIIRKLRSDPELSRQSWQASVHIWVSSTGSVQTVAVDRSSGILAVDQRIGALAGEVSVERPPPASVVQPLRFEFQSRP